MSRYAAIFRRLFGLNLHMTGIIITDNIQPTEGKMLKGLNRSVIVVRTDRKSRFEAVYFVLKKGAVSDKVDIIKEANRIISESSNQCHTKRKANFGFSLLLILGGILIGALSASAMMLILL